jgi:hypothetical protein
MENPKLPPRTEVWVHSARCLGWSVEITPSENDDYLLVKREGNARSIRVGELEQADDERFASLVTWLVDPLAGIPGTQNVKPVNVNDDAEGRALASVVSSLEDIARAATRASVCYTRPSAARPDEPARPSDLLTYLNAQAGIQRHMLDVVASLAEKALDIYSGKINGNLEARVAALEIKTRN